MIIITIIIVILGYQLYTFVVRTMYITITVTVIIL